MKTVPAFESEMLIVGMLSVDESAKKDAVGRLERLYGSCRYAGPTLPFTYTDYYFEEMGSPIFRDFIAFDGLMDPSHLAEIKTASNEIEEQFRAGNASSGSLVGTTGSEGRPGGRLVNLDPGFLSLGKLILASTKDNAQRIPLRWGIFAEVTLIYRDKAYRPLPWTYPDYRSGEYLEIFSRLRSELKAKYSG